MSIPRLVVRLAGVETVHKSCLVPMTIPFDNMTDKGFQDVILRIDSACS